MLRSRTIVRLVMNVDQLQKLGPDATELLLACWSEASRPPAIASKYYGKVVPALVTVSVASRTLTVPYHAPRQVRCAQKRRVLSSRRRSRAAGVRRLVRPC